MKRIERSNGLDTVRYKNYLYLFFLDMYVQNRDKDEVMRKILYRWKAKSRQTKAEMARPGERWPESMWNAVAQLGRTPDSQSSERGSNPPLLPFQILGIFVLSIDAPVDSAGQFHRD